MSSIAKRVLVIGDSNACTPYLDTGAPDASRAWPHQLQDLTKYLVMNFSAPGNRISVGGAPLVSAQGNLQAFNYLSGVLAPDIAIIQSGTNDFAGSDIKVYQQAFAGQRTFHLDYRSVISYLKSCGITKILCMSPLWRADEATLYPHPDGAWPLSTWRSWIHDFAAEANVAFLPHDVMGLTPTDFIADGLHLNASGCDKVAIGVRDKFQALGWL